MALLPLTNSFAANSKGMGRIRILSIFTKNGLLPKPDVVAIRLGLSIRQLVGSENSEPERVAPLRRMLAHRCSLVS
jgi:hypothetical protein